MLQLVTGWDSTPEELRESVQRIATAKKLFNIRAGWQPSEDTLPARFFQQQPSDGGAPVIDRTAVEAAIRAYNVARGWTDEGWLNEGAIAAVER